MAKFVFLAMTNARPDRDDEFNGWYDGHLAALLETPGCRAVQRFRLDAAQMVADQPYEYLALYEIETDDAAGTMTAFGARAAALGITPAMDGAPLVSLFAPIGSRVTADGAND